jgi:hypothetical protein
MDTILLSTNTDQKERDVFRTISLTALLTGTLDIIAASIHFYFNTDRGAALKLTGTEEPLPFITYLTHGGADRLFRYIARALFEPTTNGKLLVAWGVVFHYTIVFMFTGFLFLIYPGIIKWLKNKIVVGFIYGLFIWSMMNLVVLPLSKLNKFPTDPENAIIGELILTFMIGLPVALIAHRFYSKKPAG